MKRSNRGSLKPLQNGQVWRLKDSSVEIQLVGKTLVHYKVFKGETKRAPASLSGKDALEKFLRAQKGVLVRE